MDYRDRERRQQTQARIVECERLGKFNDTVEDDPPYESLNPQKIDMLRKKLSNKLKTYFSNQLARAFINREIRKKRLMFDPKTDINGGDNLVGIKGGAIITLNHVHPYDHYLAYLAFRRYFGYWRFRLFKVIKESNYTHPGWVGVFMRNCNTVPVSDTNVQLTKHSLSAVGHLLKKGKKICVFAESSLWHCYKKPRPTKLGAFLFAASNNVPVIPCFLTMTDSDKIGNDGLVVQKFVFNIMPPIYPDSNLTTKQNCLMLQQKNQQAWTTCYESVYGIKLEDKSNDKL